MEEKVLHINLIGEFRLCWGNVVINHEVIRQRKGRSLLKLLAITPGHALQREQIMDVLWPETSPEKAANSLYNTVYLIRRELNQGGGDAGGADGDRGRNRPD